VCVFATRCRKGWVKAPFSPKIHQGAGNGALSRVFLPPHAEKIGGRHYFLLRYAKGLATEPFHVCFRHPLPKRLGEGAVFSYVTARGWQRSPFVCAFTTPCRKSWGKVPFLLSYGKGLATEPFSRVLSPSLAEKVGGRHRLSQVMPMGWQ
jgi:hypothetical protein